MTYAVIGLAWNDVLRWCAKEYVAGKAGRWLLITGYLESLGPWILMTPAPVIP